MGLWGSKLQQCVTRGSSDGYYQTMESSSSSSSTPIEAGSRKLDPEWLERFLKRTFFDPCSEHFSRRNELNKYCIDCDKALCQHCLSVDPHEDHRLLKIYRHVYKDVVPLDEIERHIDCSQIQPYRCNKQLVIAATPLPHSGTKHDDEETCQTCHRKLMKYDLFSYCSISCKVEAFLQKEDEDSPPFLSLGLVVQNSNQGAEPKNLTLDQPVPDSKQEALKTTTIDQQVQNANQEPELESELKKTTVDQPVQNANEEPELDSELKKRTVDQSVENANQETVVNKRTRRRKGIPHRAPFF
ncbi:uncharacterized protein LOC141605956 [Silene latifolia]|uniref:uncharacterized protein LOC141605956 n=1 Tax=Silene latifolia TaxID=37657 RepID=UPI003D77C600